MIRVTVDRRVGVDKERMHPCEKEVLFRKEPSPVTGRIAAEPWGHYVMCSKPITGQ